MNTRIIARLAFKAGLRRPIAGLALAGLSLTLVACGGSGGSGEPDTNAPMPTDLSIGFSTKIRTLEPYQVQDSGALVASHFLGGNLLDMHDDAGVTQPGLAESADPSADGLKWTVKLRPGLKFSDGSPLTSKDVKGTFDYALTSETNLQKFAFEPISSVEAPSADIAVINLKRPYPALAKLLGYWDFAIYPADKIGQKDFFNDPVTAGPYEIESWGGSDTLVLTSNPNFWGSKPVIKKITFKTVPDANAALTQVKTGQLDMVWSLPTNLAKQVTSPAILSIVPLHGSDTLRTNTKVKPLDVVNVRQAISAALDRDEIVRTTWGDSDGAKPLAGFWPASMTGYDRSVSAAQDLDRAKGLLRGTSCESGCDLTLTYSTAAYPEQTTEAVAIAQQLGEVGIKVKLNNLDATSYQNAMFEYDYELSLGPTYDLADIPDNFMAYGLLPAFGANYSQFSISGIEDLWKTVATTTGAEQAAALAKVEKQFAEYTPWISLSGRGLVVAQRVPLKAAKVLSTTVVAVAHEDGTLW